MIESQEDRTKRTLREESHKPFTVLEVGHVAPHRLVFCITPPEELSPFLDKQKEKAS